YARGSGFGAFSRSSLWLGPDHLLLVERRGYTENYKRFFFRDIQSLTIRQTNRHKIWSLILGIIAAICFALAFVILAAEGVIGFWIMIGMAAFFSFFLGLNVLAGPASTCHLRTAVQTEELPSLSRLKRVRKVLERVR